MSMTILLASIAGQRVAIDAQQVKSVIRINHLARVPASQPWIRGLAALRSRVLTVIDSACLVTGDITPDQPFLTCVVLQWSGSDHAMMVDSVSDVCTIAASPIALSAAISPAWQTLAGATISVDGAPVLLIDPHHLLNGLIAIEAARAA